MTTDRSIPILLLLLAGIYLAISPIPAVAGTIALQPLHFEEAPDSFQGAWEQAMRKQAQKTGLTFLSSDQVSQVVREHAKGSDPKCLTPDCMQAVARALDVDYTVTGQVNGTASRFVIEFWFVAAGEPVIKGRVSGESESDPETLAPLLEDLTEQLVQLMDSGQGVLDIRTLPDSSRVEIDGIPVGISPVNVQRPGDRRYEITGVRLGYHTKSRTVYLNEQDTVRVELKLRKDRMASKTVIPSMRGWLMAGLPMYQSSGAMDTGISWGSGSTFGAHFEMGANWRVRFSFYNYTGEVESVDVDPGSRFAQAQSPRGSALVVSPSLIYSSTTGPVTPLINLGLAWMQRELELDLADGGNESRRTSFQPGFIFGLGLEWKLYGPIAMQFDMQFSRTFERGDSYKQQGEQIDPAWDRGFESFRDFTMIRLGVGYRM